MRSREIKRRQGIRRRGRRLYNFIRILPELGMLIINAHKTIKGFKELFFRICVFATILLAMTILWRVARPGANLRVSPDTVAAFRVPHRAIGMLADYAHAHDISFPELFALFNAENNFFPEKTVAYDLTGLERIYVANFDRLWRRYNNRSIAPYVDMFCNLFSEIEAFPIPSGWYQHDPSVMFGNSWGVEHNFQGKPMHMGTAIIDRENIRGRVPIVSMTAGTVTNAGWNNQLGYFVIITTQNDTHYLYAHLDSIAAGLAAGQIITAGQPIGRMGNSGGGRNSRSFPVHLHLAISPNVSFTRGQFWINPYPLLRYLENRHNL
ncbi:MAG: M23 family metallopeptidase [Firmicutes bacterium]|nr:M23 family metallopeptidase [Bacillota bacterium]